MKLINLTPHPVQIWGHDKKVIVIPAELQPARCKEEAKAQGYLHNPNENYEVKIVSLSYTDVYHLPEPVDGTYYIVSVLVAQARPERVDLLVPYDLVRNDNGSIMGCRSLARIK